MTIDSQSFLMRRLSKHLCAYATSTQQIQAMEGADALRMQYEIQSRAFEALQLLAHYYYESCFVTQKTLRISHKSGRAVLGFRQLKPALTKPERMSWAELGPLLYQIDPEWAIQRPDISSIAALSPQDDRYPAVRALGIQRTQDESFFVDLQ